MVVPVLITMSISNFCEKARWALDYCQIQYVEEPHVPGSHKRATKPLGGTTVPVLDVGEGRAIIDSSTIVAWADEHCTRQSRPKLIPKNPTQRKLALELATLFGDKLGPSARAIMLHHLSSAPHVAIRYLMEPDAGGFESCLIGCCRPVLSQAMAKSLKLPSEDKEREAIDTLDDMFDMVGAKIQGRKYLLGETFGVADLCFAALAAPVLFPDEMALMRRMFADREMPRTLVQLVNKYRKTPAGQYALRLYKEERYPKSVR